MSKKKKVTRDPDKLGSPRGPSTPEEFETDLRYLSSNLYGLYVKDVEISRFLKVIQRERGNWLAIAGSYDELDQPIVCFGNGHTFAIAIYSLGRAMSSGAWREDKFARDK